MGVSAVDMHKAGWLTMGASFKTRVFDQKQEEGRLILVRLKYEGITNDKSNGQTK
jgi:hypothetical protein